MLLVYIIFPLLFATVEQILCLQRFVFYESELLGFCSAIEKSTQSKLEDSRQATQQRLVRSLREYRNMFAVQHRTSNRLIFPESLKLLPLYTLAICKNLALRGGYGDCSPDERSAMGFEIMTMSTTRLLKLLYPSLMRLDEYLYQVRIKCLFPGMKISIGCCAGLSPMLVRFCQSLSKAFCRK